MLNVEWIREAFKSVEFSTFQNTPAPPSPIVGKK